MKAVQIVRKNNTRNLLTVAADRITIKIKDGQTPEHEQRVQTFLTKVAQKLDGELSTMRGALLDEDFKITMKGGHHSTPRSVTFHEEDI